MASGSYNIDTFSWYRSLPLSNDTTPFSTLTMFAVGPSSFMKNYTFYDYTWANGFPDTSTFSVSITSFVDQAITSTTQALGKVFMSTIPYTQWISSGNSYDYPVAGSVAVISSFSSNYNAFGRNYPDVISTPTVWLGEGMTRLINSQQYNVFVDLQYSLYLSTPHEPKYTWISTVGLFKSGNPAITQNAGRTQTTRMGNNQYLDIHTKLMYAPEPVGNQTQIMPFTSSFTFNIWLVSTTTTTLGVSPAYELYVPGENNLTFTLVPAVSTVTVL